MKIALVACVAEKRFDPMPAGELYNSQWFRKARAYVERRVEKGELDGWYILSAEHGLLSPDQVIEPYDKSLTTMERQDREVWNTLVWEQLKEVLGPYKFEEGFRGPHTITFLAGRRYRDMLALWCDAYYGSANVPMEGLGIGQQLQWLNVQGPG